MGASEVPKFVVRGNQLTINYVDETDNGKYSCHAYNEYDRKGARAEFNLNVIGKFDFFASAFSSIYFARMRDETSDGSCSTNRACLNDMHDFNR